MNPENEELPDNVPGGHARLFGSACLRTRLSTVTQGSWYCVLDAATQRPLTGNHEAMHGEWRIGQIEKRPSPCGPQDR
jgi:hypothetical protein